MERRDTIASEDIILCWHLSSSVEEVTLLDQEILFKTLSDPVNSLWMNLDLLHLRTKLDFRTIKETYNLGTLLIDRSEARVSFYASLDNLSFLTVCPYHIRFFCSLTKKFSL